MSADRDLFAPGLGEPGPREGPSSRGDPIGSPLRDPRAWGSSILFHAALLAIASLVVLRATRPVVAPPAEIVQADLGPIDNRAGTDSGGGGPGELGGVGPADAPRITVDRDAPNASDLAGLDGVEELLDLPPRPVTPEVVAEDLPGPPLSGGAGIVAGPGLGGGGGSGGGSGGGVGSGLGPSTTFFGATEHASSFAYVIDRSGSMSGRGSLDLAKVELLASLQLLPPDARFGVLFYNLEPLNLVEPGRPPTLLPATAANKEGIRSRLATVTGLGGTDHARALRAAFALEPEVVFLLTDGLLMTREQAEAIRAEAGRIRIHVIEFGTGPEPPNAGPVRWLAGSTGGTYRYVDVVQFRRAKSAGN